MVYQAVTVAKRTYAASAWWGFASAVDLQRLEAFLRRDKRSGLCSRDQPAIAELVDCAGDVLFNNVLDNPYHVLHNSMPNETVSTYALRRRPHNRELVNSIKPVV